MPKNVLICQACKLKLTWAEGQATESVAKHRQGKRHRKGLEERNMDDDEARLFVWDLAHKWEKTREEEERADGVQTITAEEARRLAGKGEKEEKGMRLLGQGVAMAVGEDVDPAELEKGGWRRVGGGASKPSKGSGSSGGGGASGGGGGGDGAAIARDIMSNMLHLEGGRNVLEGFVVHSRFLTAGAEQQLAGWIEQSIRGGQQGRLRGSTYTAPRPIPGTSAPGVPPAQAPAMLNFGCYYDIVEHSVVNGKLVDPMPPQLQDIARRIAARGEWLAGKGGSKGGKADVPDCCTVLELQPGQYVPPHTLPAGFEAPMYWLGVECPEDIDLVMGLRIGRIEGGRAGDFASSFAHRFARRSLLAFRGTSAELTRTALASVSSRMVLLIFRTMNKELRAEMEARGNVA